MKIFPTIVFWSIGILLFGISVFLLSDLAVRIADVGHSYFNWMTWVGVFGVVVSFLYLIFFLFLISYSLFWGCGIDLSSLERYSLNAIYAFFLIPVILGMSDIVISIGNVVGKFGSDKRPLLVLSSDMFYAFIVYLIVVLIFSLARLFKKFDLKLVILSSIPVACLLTLVICFYNSVITIKS